MENHTFVHPESYALGFSSLNLLKIVICEVPTEAGQYADYKLIALFDRGLAYLEGGRQEWKNLRFAHHNACAKFSDAIEHGGTIFAVDEIEGTMYCWDPAATDGIFSIHMFY